MREDPMSTVTAPLPVRTWTFVLLCASAGGLAVPLQAVATPVSAVVAGLAGLFGLRVWRWSGLPGLMKSAPPLVVRRLVQPAAWMGLGLIVGLVLLAAIRLVIEPAVPGAGARIAAAGGLPVWRRLVIIYVAAVSEELVFRLLLLSLIAGLTTRGIVRSELAPGRRIVWVANGLSALAFAGVHLPSWTAMGHLSAGLALLVLALNGLGGVVLGEVFVRRGIVAAMWTHAGADCAIQLIGPLTR
jgi:membrane protease YdiL (CAAX protease family)